MKKNGTLAFAGVPFDHSQVIPPRLSPGKRETGESAGE